MKRANAWYLKKYLKSFWVLGFVILSSISCDHFRATANGMSKESSTETPAQTATNLEQESPDADAETIRAARQAQFADRLANPQPSIIEPYSLLNGCKYESEIPTPPPHMKVALTFDDGPLASQTPWVLDVLEKYHIHATFFMIGSKAQGSPELVQMVANRGHMIVGNHSWTHPNFHDLSASAQAAEVLKTENLLSSHLHPKLFRYPYGNSSCATNNLLHSRGYKIVGWHVDSCDWAFNKTGTVSETDARICGVTESNRSHFVNHVVSSLRARRGGILLMHEIQPHTIRQLETIIRDLISDGFDFGTLDDPDFQSSLR